MEFAPLVCIPVPLDSGRATPSYFNVEYSESLCGLWEGKFLLLFLWRFRQWYVQHWTVESLHMCTQYRNIKYHFSQHSYSEGTHEAGICTFWVYKGPWNTLEQPCKTPEGCSVTPTVNTNRDRTEEGQSTGTGVVSALLGILLLSCFPCPTAVSWNNHFIFYAEEKEIWHCWSALLLQLQ